MTIESDVLKSIRPTSAQDRKVASVVEELSERVVAEARKLDAHVETMLVGSVAKGTHLKDPDIDLFILFPESTPLDRMKDVGLEIGRRVLKGREHYAQHPYVRGVFDGFQVDLVPCFRIRDTRHKMSAVDRTPFHTEFVKKNLRKGTADQVRLLKQFMKGTECYGAEARVQGFSGYLCELLIMRFGGFREVLEAAKDWTVGEHIELPEYQGKEFKEPLTFIDPVDTARNVASAVSVETMLRFVLASREYLSNPDRRLFFPNERKTWDAAKIREVAGARLENTMVVSFAKLPFIDDIVYPQLRKSLAAMTALMARFDFEVDKSTIHVDEFTHLVIELAAMSLPKSRKHRGPPANSDNVNEFLTKWNAAGTSAPFIEEERWYVMTNRQHTRADDLLRAKIASVPLGKDVHNLKRFDIVSGDALLSKRNLGALTHHFDTRMPWQR